MSVDTDRKYDDLLMLINKTFGVSRGNARSNDTIDDVRSVPVLNILRSFVELSKELENAQDDLDKAEVAVIDGGDFSVGEDHSGKYVRLTGTSDCVITLDENLSLDEFPIGNKTHFINADSAKTCSFVPGSTNVTLLSVMTDPALRALGSAAVLIRVDVNSWDLMGDISEIADVVL